MFCYTFLPRLLNMSLTASVVIVAVLVARSLLRKAPKVISYGLWAVVLFRLLCPVSIPSDLSLFGLLDAPVEERGTVTSRIVYVTGDAAGPEAPTGVDHVTGDGPAQGQEAWDVPTVVAVCVWMAGVLGMVGYGAVSYVGLRRKLLTSVRLRDNIWLADDIASPFVLGLFRPRIYLPSSMEERERAYIILHEQCHIRRLDHIWKGLGYAALCIHWFNPLVWAAFLLAGKDMEMSCDEAVVKKLGPEVLADYAASLLSLATGRRILAGVPLAFGEGDPKGRIHNLAHWRKPTRGVILAAVVVCGVLAVCLLTNPANDIRNPWVQEYVPGAEGIVGSVDKEGYEQVSEDFAIGANQHGQAVFKDPYKAFDTMVELCGEGIALIRDEYPLLHLVPISRSHYSIYQTYGGQVTTGSAEAQEQARFLSGFLDIYENSFKEYPSTASAENAVTEPDDPVDDTQIPYREPTSDEVALYSSAFRAFGYEPEAYDFYIYFQVRERMTVQELSGINSILRPLDVDFVPTFFADKENEILYVLARNDTGTIYLCSLQPNPNAEADPYANAWILVEDVRSMEYRYEFDPD